MPNHAKPITVLDFVKSRLKTLVDVNNEEQVSEISVITFDVMIEIEACLKVRYRELIDSVLTTVETENQSNIGNEDFYKTIEVSLISDLVSLQYLFNLSVSRSIEVGSADVENPLLYFKKAQAGSADAEFGLGDIKNFPFVKPVEQLMGKLKDDAIRKARQLGCKLSLLDNGAFIVMLNNAKLFQPTNFMVYRSNCN